MLKEFIKAIPIVGPLARTVAQKVRASRDVRFETSTQYWRDRYAQGGNSGDGSYGDLAHFKAEVLNAFVNRNKVRTVIEFGCGDGNQLTLAHYPSYVGYDVSPTAVDSCRKRFAGDATKRFGTVEEYSGETADLALSLDVIYHLTEQQIYEEYMHRLVTAGDRFVIIYSSDTDEQLPGQVAWVKHRKVTDWMNRHAKTWRLVERIPNRFPYNANTDRGSLADFFIYERT
jgi:SAM-dependent methyltransferase